MELLAPAGSYQALVAAVEAGADAVYTGGKLFSARRQATNLDDDEMQKAVVYCHLRDRKLYVTVNTLIADSEMEAAIDYICRLQHIGIDGVIVQDLGLMSAVRQLLPDLRLHASTQMSIHNQAGVEWAGEQGLRRVVLARELSMAQVKMISQACPNMELEMFGHGALCFSFSGQCLFSSLVGGRSGNRGNCAQPCRLPYQLYNSGGEIKQIAGQHLLSPADLCLLPHIQEMESVGVSSLKIEGRMKRPEYVATVTRVYRQAIDRQGDLTPEEMQKGQHELTAAFNRNFTSGFWSGEAADWLSPQRPNNRGLLVGRIVSTAGGLALISLKEELRNGDGIEVWTSSGNNAVTVVRRILLAGVEVLSAPAGSKVEIEIDHAAPGDRVFKTSDVVLIEQAQELTKENRWVGRRQVNLWCRAQVGEPFQVTIKDMASGLIITSASEGILSNARKEASTVEQIEDKIGELGDTAFAIQELTVDVDGQCLVPFSWIKEVRRKAVEELKSTLLQENLPSPQAPDSFAADKVKLLKGWRSIPVNHQRAVRLTVAVDRVEAGLAALSAGADRVYLNLAGSKNFPLHDKAWQELLAARNPNQQVLALLPRILLPGEHSIITTDADGVVITNPGWLVNKSDLQVGDYSLNVFNTQTAAYLLNRGLDTVCTSLELNLQQIKALALRFPQRLECLVHGDIPIMTSRFCLLGHTADASTCNRCTRPCGRDDYHLHDRKGYDFPLRTDSYGRFYVYNSRTLCVLEDIEELVRSGLGALRLQLSLAEPAMVREVTAIYRQVIDQSPSSGELARVKDKLRQLAPSDFTKLHYYRGVI